MTIIPQTTVLTSLCFGTLPSLFDEDNGDFLQSLMLIGSNSERNAFFEHLKEQVAKSETEDAAKHSTKEATNLWSKR